MQALRPTEVVKIVDVGGRIANLTKGDAITYQADKKSLKIFKNYRQQTESRLWFKISEIHRADFYEIDFPSKDAFLSFAIKFCADFGFGCEEKVDYRFSYVCVMT